MMGKEVLHPEDWIGTTRFQIFWIELPEGYTWVNGSDHTGPKDNTT